MKITSFSILLFLFFTHTLQSQPTAFSARGIGGGGALFSLSINPADSKEYYVSCDMGELFHTTDFGNSYTQIHFQQVIGGHNSKVCFTSTPGLLYTVSYENDLFIPKKSTDNGLSWNALSGNPDNSEEIFSINADYKHPERVLISYYNTVYFSSNGGASFTGIHTALNSGSGIVVGGVFFDGNTIYMGTNDGVLISANGGSTWAAANITGLPSSEQIWSFAGARSGSTTRFFCITADAGDIYAGVAGSDYYGFMKGVYAVDYGAGNWTSRMLGISPGTDFPMFVAMAENDVNTVYLAGSNDSAVPDILKTNNAGLSWNHTFQSTGNKNIITGWSGQGGDRGWSYGECPFGMAVAADDPNTVIFGDFGFVHKTADGGTTWQQAYVDAAGQHAPNAPTPANQSYQSIGLENTTCWQVHWSNKNDVWACFSDIHGIRSTDGGSSWSFNYTGNSANSTYRVVEQASSGILFAATSGIHDMYQSTRLADTQLDAADPNGNILYSTDLGKTWENVHAFGHPVFWITLDPANPNRAYASVIHYKGGSGIGGIYRCDDLQNLATSTWTLLPDPPRTEKHPASIEVLNDGKMVCTFSGRRTTAFTASSGVFMYDPVNGSWTDVSDAGMHYWTKDLIIDPNDPQQNTWYAGVFSGWGGAPNGLGGLYQTTNRGKNWKKITGNLLDRVTSCTFNPKNSDEVFVTTETQGLWSSESINSASPVFKLVDSYPFKQPERVFFNPYNTNELWVTSFGNGMKMGTLSPVAATLDFQANTTDPFIISPNPSDGQINLQGNTSEEISVFTIMGECVFSASPKKAAGRLDLSSLPAGMYFIKDGKKSAKLILNQH